MSTEGADYTARLKRLSSQGWKTRVDVQLPYRWNLRRLTPGRVLDVGCGLGRNLLHLGGNGVGIDHNPSSVEAARAAGLTAYLPEDFHQSLHARPHGYDALLLAHVLEHVDAQAADDLMTDYLPFIRPGGRVILITPQERGFATDATHVRWVDAERSQQHLLAHGLLLDRHYSFPFPRAAGKVFPYNEFVVTGRLTR